MIQFFFENTEVIKLPAQLAAWAENIIIAEQKKPGKISYIFCDDEHLLEINRTYLDHDYYTDIITFDYVKGKTISGDIFVSLQRISDNANVHSREFENELLRVVAHGVLHLCGYKDKTDFESQEMRAKEDFYINTYLGFI